MDVFQARTQGFEKGGYILKNPINFWHVNVKLFMTAYKNIQFHREHEAH